MASDETCLISEKTTIRGHISGQQALMVEGRVEGRVTLDSAFTVEPSGVVEADVSATSATVKGEMRGLVQASSQAVLLASSKMTGKVKAPQIVIEDGAQFSGEIEMDVDLPDGIKASVS